MRIYYTLKFLFKILFLFVFNAIDKQKAISQVFVAENKSLIRLHELLF